MSIRPSSRIRSNANTPLPADTAYVIIGDTMLATIYATKLYTTFQNNTPQPQIHMLSTGNDQTGEAIESLDYIMEHSQTIYKTLKPELVHLVLDSNEPINSNLAPGNTLLDQYYYHYSGAGPLGDGISSYYTGFAGPYYTMDSRGRLDNFVKASTIQKDLTTSEFNVMNNIASLFNLAKTNSVVATQPSILTQNYIFVFQDNTKLERQLYLKEYNLLIHPKKPNVNSVTKVNNIKIGPATGSTMSTNLGSNMSTQCGSMMSTNVGSTMSTNSCLSTVTYSTSSHVQPPPSTCTSDTTIINNACILWMNNLYSYVRIMGMNNIEHKKVSVPVFYRSVYSIPKVTPYINLANLNPNAYPLHIGDGLTTRLAFTCTDVAQPGESMNNRTPQWNLAVYTTDEDFSDPNNSGVYADVANGKTLLIIEGISLNNRRVFTWDGINSAVSVGLNSNELELGVYEKFLLISANVYQAYTGAIPALPIGVQSVCNNGVCSDYYTLQHSSDRESPLIMQLRMLTSLYGGTSWPTPNSVNNQSCCG